MFWIFLDCSYEVRAGAFRRLLFRKVKAYKSRMRGTTEEINLIFPKIQDSVYKKPQYNPITIFIKLMANFWI